jgi:hemolysin activation/secretion protein
VLTLKQLEEFADKVTKVYRDAGYTVARAYIPPQNIVDGVVEMAVVEGRFGDLIIKPSSTLDEKLLRGMFNANGCSGVAECQGQVIQGANSDRVLLLLRDIPGLTAQASLQAGKAQGTSDYVLDVRAARLSSFSAGYDNYGSPSVGKNRLNYSANFYNLKGRGAQLSFDLSSMGVKHLVGGATYSLPVGYYGTRAGVGYVHSISRLGGAFAALNATVTGDSISVYALHPVVRSLNESLFVRVAAEVGGGNMNVSGTSFHSNSTTNRLNLSGDRVDKLGGYTVYGIGVAAGHYGSEFDGSNGRFNKLSYNLARQQTVSGAFTLYGSLAGQIANMALPSGELIGLGGPGSIRAYPAGEGGNAVGGVGTLEARYTQVLTTKTSAVQQQLLTYSLFADRGWSDSYRGANTSTASRALGGVGVGINLIAPSYYLRTSLAKHSRAGLNASQIDPASSGQFWLQAGLNY